MRRLVPLLSLLCLATAQINGGALVARYAKIARTEELIEKSMEIRQIDFERFQMEKLLPYIATSDDAQTPSKECTDDLGLLRDSVLSILNPNRKGNLTDFDKEVTMNVLDSSAKIGNGILRGHLNFYGLFGQCRAIQFPIENSTRKWEGDYFRMHISYKFANYTDAGACGTTFGWDICMPKICTNEEITRVFRSALGSLEQTLEKDLSNFLTLNFTNPICEVVNVNTYQTKAKPGTYIVATVMLLVIATCIISGFYDYFLLDLVKGAPFTKGFAHQVFISFSIYRNISEIFSTGSSKKAGQIGPIHCIRFFSMIWVMMGHITGLFMEFSSNPRDVINETKNPTTEFLTNAYFSVDSFFFMSGLLLSFIWFKDYKKNKKRAMSPIAWVMFYVHRIIRLSPPYYFLIFFYTFVFRQWIFDMPIYLKHIDSEFCDKNWWIDLLYLNNFIDYKHQCYLVSWYLSTDLQIYLFAPLILIPLALNMWVGLVIAFVVFSLSTAANIFTVYHFYFPPSDYTPLLGVQDPRMTDPKYGNTDFDKYTLLIYDAPWIRCQVYIIGMLVGYMLQYVRKLRVNKILNFALWIASGAMMLSAALGLHAWTNESHDWNKGWHMSLFWRAMYSAFSRVAWGAGLSWIVISCFYGHGGPINQFMSWNIWVPLGRLSYCAYLLHITIVMYFMGIDQSELIWSNFTDTLLSYVFPAVAVTYFFAIFWSACFEMSLGKVEGLLIGGLRGRPTAKPVVMDTKPPAETSADVVDEKPIAATRPSTVAPLSESKEGDSWT